MRVHMCAHKHASVGVNSSYVCVTVGTREMIGVCKDS